MSAPITHRLPSKETMNLLTKTHFIVSTCLLLIILLSFSQQSFLNIVNNKFMVTKFFIFLIFVFNVVFYKLVMASALVSTKQSSILSKVRLLLKNGILLFISSLFFHVIAVLFGAPLLESSAETFHFGMILTMTAVLPALCVMGTNTSQWVKVFAQNSPDLGAESIVYFSALCSVIGAWLGAFPIPLDWDRPWQEWPITCIIGTLFGYCTGVLIGTVHLYINYHRIKRVKIT